MSRKPHARILSIDDSGAKSSPGFAGIFFAKDVPGDSFIGPVIADEELFASEFVTCVGQVKNIRHLPKFHIWHVWIGKGLSDSVLQILCKL